MPFDFGGNYFGTIKLQINIMIKNQQISSNENKNLAIHNYSSTNKVCNELLHTRKKIFHRKKITHPIINTNLHRKWLPKRRHHTIHSGF